MAPRVSSCAWAPAAAIRTKISVRMTDLPSSQERRLEVVAIHTRDVGDRDLLRAHGFALTFVRAAAEALGVMPVDHPDDARVALGLSLRQQAEVRDLGRGEERCRRVLARRDARAAADALRRVHRQV